MNNMISDEVACVTVCCNVHDTPYYQHNACAHNDLIATL